MKAHLINGTLLFLVAPLFAQSPNNNSNPAVTEYFIAHQVEEIKGSEDCYIISFTPIHSNKTLTKKDDKQLGVFYYVTGEDCRDVFDKKFLAMRSLSGIENESYTLPGTDNIDPQYFSKINTVIRHKEIAPGGTYMYLMWLFGDNHTSDPRDDILLGVDYVIDSNDPDEINTSFDMGELEEDLALYPQLQELIATNTYYKLREMIVNEKLIVEGLRHDNALKQIGLAEY